MVRSCLFCIFWERLALGTGKGIWRRVYWAQGDEMRVEGLPAADDGDGHQGHDKHDPCCC